MLTLKKRKLYRKYKGNADMFSRTALPWQRNKLDSEDWGTTSQFAQDLKIVHRGLAAQSYEEAVMNRVWENCEDDEVMTELGEMARAM